MDISGRIIRGVGTASAKAVNHRERPRKLSRTSGVGDEVREGVYSMEYI